MSVVYCPSSPVYEDGKQVGWFYGIHVVNLAPEENEVCPTCGMNLKLGDFSSPVVASSQSAASHADNLEVQPKEK